MSNHLAYLLCFVVAAVVESRAKVIDAIPNVSGRAVGVSWVSAQMIAERAQRTERTAVQTIERMKSSRRMLLTTYLCLHLKGRQHLEVRKRVGYLSCPPDDGGWQPYASATSRCGKRLGWYR